MRGLYIHIPFCKHICNYCDFPKRIALNNEQIELYINHLINELDSYSSYYKSVKTIYIGGGTPNILDDSLMVKLLAKVKGLVNNPIEFSIECNPELVTLSQANIFKEYGITRISLGVESFNDESLKKLNRHHTKADAIKAVEIFRSVGIENINVDLIYAHPYDSFEEIKNNLTEFFKLKIPHLSYYSMILEEKTVFSHLEKQGKLKLLDNDIEADMYSYIIKELKNANYHHYETSNFAIEGFESRHNLLYWDSLEYIGAGAGASGYLDSVRYTNSSKLFDYYKGIKETEEISSFEKKKEFMMLGFRKIDGIKISEYTARFNSDLFLDFNLDTLIKNGLIEKIEDNIRLTSRGVMLANEVFMEFV